MPNDAKILTEIALDIREIKDKLGQVKDDAKDTGKSIKQVFESISGSFARIGLAVNGIREVFGIIKGTLGLPIEAASEFEFLRLRLQALYGDVDRGNQVFETFKELAATTPYSLQQVVEAGASLKAFGADAEGLLGSMADLAAFMGVDIVMAASSFGRAFAAGAGAADILRERGVLTLLASLHGVTDWAKVSLPEFREMLIQYVADPTGQVAGSAERVSESAVGALSNLGDAWTQFWALVGERILPAYTYALRRLSEWLTDIKENSDVLFDAWVKLYTYMKLMIAGFVGLKAGLMAAAVAGKVYTAWTKIQKLQTAGLAAAQATLQALMGNFVAIAVAAAAAATTYYALTKLGAETARLEQEALNASVRRQRDLIPETAAGIQSALIKERREVELLRDAFVKLAEDGYASEDQLNMMAQEIALRDNRIRRMERELELMEGSLEVIETSFAREKALWDAGRNSADDYRVALQEMKTTLLQAIATAPAETAEQVKALNMLLGELQKINAELDDIREPAMPKAPESDEDEFPEDLPDDIYEPYEGFYSDIAALNDDYYNGVQARQEQMRDLYIGSLHDMLIATMVHGDSITEIWGNVRDYLIEATARWALTEITQHAMVEAKKTALLAGGVAKRMALGAKELMADMWGLIVKIAKALWSLGPWALLAIPAAIAGTLAVMKAFMGQAKSIKFFGEGGLALEATPAIFGEKGPELATPMDVLNAAFQKHLGSFSSAGIEARLDRIERAITERRTLVQGEQLVEVSDKILTRQDRGRLE